MNNFSVILRRFGLLLVAAVLFLYSWLGSLFAKQCISVSVLPVPLFPGEMVLLLLLVILMLYFIFGKLPLHNWHGLLIIYMLIILVCACIGFQHWGGLAFRHAALYYYPLFAVIVNCFSDPDFFKLKFIRWVLLIMICALMIFGIPSYYYIYPYCLIFCLLAFMLNRNFIIFGAVLGLIFLYQYQVFNGSKGVFISAGVSLLYILLAAVILFNRRKTNLRLRLLFWAATMAVVLITSFVVLNKGMTKRMAVWGDIQHNSAEYKTDLKTAEAVARDTEQIRQAPYSVIYPINNTAGSSSSPAKAVKIYSTAQRPAIMLSKRTAREDLNNILWRVFVWKDMLGELISQKRVFGFGFGKPFRSKTVEALRWESGEETGWIEPHNSYLHIVYRSGILGLVGILFVFFILFRLLSFFVYKNNFLGILLGANLLYWVILANFIVLLELPYFAIPFWSFYGLTYAYYKYCRQQDKVNVLLLGYLAPPFGGLETVTKNILGSSLLQDKYNIHFLKIRTVKQANERGRLGFVNIYCNLMNMASYIYKLVFSYDRLVYCPISQNKIGFFRDSLFILVGSLFGKRVVVHFHGGNFDLFFARQPHLTKLYIKFVFARVDALIVLADYIKLQFDGLISLKKVHVVHNGIDYSFLPENIKRNKAKNEPINILFVGYISKAKGALDTVMAAEIIKRKYDNVNIRLIGSPIDQERNVIFIDNPNNGYRDSLEFISRKGLSSNVTIDTQSIQSDKLKYFIDADIFVFPSYSEGFGLVVLEAMAAGLPVVMSRVGGLSEILREPDNCYFIEPGDYRELADKIILLMDDPALRDKMGRNNLKLVKEKLNLDGFIKGLIQVWEHVLGSEGKIA